MCDIRREWGGKSEVFTLSLVPLFPLFFLGGGDVLESLYAVECSHPCGRITVGKKKVLCCDFISFTIFGSLLCENIAVEGF